MSIGTNRSPATQESSEELAARAQDYRDRGLHELAKHWEKSAKRLKNQGR